MSDGITDAYRDQRRAECYENFLLSLATYLENQCEENLSVLKTAAAETDDVFGGLISRKTNLSEALDPLLVKLLEKNERVWLKLLFGAYGQSPDASFSRLKKISPFPDKILLQVNYGMGFVTLRGEFQDFLDRFIGVNKDLKIYDGDKYAILLSAKVLKSAEVVWLSSGISDVYGPRKARE